MRNTLLTRIEELRHKLIEKGVRDGLTSQETVSLSKELDKLINQYIRNS